jgi:hypothetical protein
LVPGRAGVTNNELSVFVIGDTCGASMSCGVVTVLTVSGQQRQSIVIAAVREEISLMDMLLLLCLGKTRTRIVLMRHRLLFFFLFIYFFKHRKQ